jgi:hypothetical protein
MIDHLPCVRGIIPREKTKSKRKEEEDEEE